MNRTPPTLTAQVVVRMTPTMRAALQAAADVNERTLTQEIRYRLVLAMRPTLDGEDMPPT